MLSSVPLLYIIPLAGVYISFRSETDISSRWNTSYIHAHFECTHICASCMLSLYDTQMRAYKWDTGGRGGVFEAGRTTHTPAFFFRISPTPTCLLHHRTGFTALASDFHVPSITSHSPWRLPSRLHVNITPAYSLPAFHGIQDGDISLTSSVGWRRNLVWITRGSSGWVKSLR